MKDRLKLVINFIIAILPTWVKYKKYLQKYYTNKK